MIPRRAFFTWVGGDELPWLRQLSVETFQRYNPDWKVELIRLPPEDDLLPAQVTDLFRYKELTAHGGFYFDTDIVFFRPVPDAWLDCEVAITVDRSAFVEAELTHPLAAQMPGFNNVAMMGCVLGSPFFHRAAVAAGRRLAWLRDDDVDLRQHLYQAFGTELLNRHWYAKEPEEIFADEDWFNLPLDSVLPIRWNELHKVYNATPFQPSDDTIGVHWYGGSVDAKRYVSTLDRESFHNRPCYITDAIERALA